LVQLVLAAGLLVAAILHAEAAAQTTDPQVEIVPLLECVARNDDGSLTAKLGWDNRSGRILRPLLGTENKIIPGRHQSVLPTEFAAGKVTTKNGGFTVTFPEDGKITWLLYEQVLEASAASPPCPPDQRGAPTTTVQRRPATTAAKGGAAPAPSSGPAKGAGKAARTTTTAPVVVAAGAGPGPGAGGGGGSLGAADVVPALLLGIGVLWMVAFGLESRRGRIRP
jgi:hypothetical protein